MFFQYLDNRAVRSAGWTLAEVDGTGWELFNTKTDPLETRNLAKSRPKLVAAMSDRWLKDLEAFATDHHKPFLETAPWLIVVFKQSYGISEGEKMNNYYVSESVGIATGFLLAAVHNAGLVALTHTPSPMDFLARLLQRPQNEKPFLLIPVGYPATGAQVPDLQRKNLEDVSVFI